LDPTPPDHRLSHTTLRGPRQLAARWTTKYCAVRRSASCAQRRWVAPLYAGTPEVAGGHGASLAAASTEAWLKRDELSTSSASSDGADRRSPRPSRCALTETLRAFQWRRSGARRGAPLPQQAAWADAPESTPSAAARRASQPTVGDSWADSRW